MISRRNLLTGAAVVAGGASLVGLASFAPRSPQSTAEAKSSGPFPFQLSDEEWMERLTPQQYYVLRDHGTERAFTSPLDAEKRAGTFHCAGCDHPVYSSEHKFDSRTGWPSFWQPINDKAIGTSTDYKLIFPRTEVHCANCGGHLGHVFNDGPQPTGERHCMNGIAMTFEPTDQTG